MPASVTSLYTAWTELMSSTWRAVGKKEAIDNVSKHNALYRRLTEKGKLRQEDGGLSIVQPLDYAANSNYQRYSGYDALNINPVDVITTVEFPWRQAAVNIPISGLEMRVNSGGNRIINLAKAKITNAIRSAANGMAVDIYSDGTASNQVNGLQALIADTPTNTVGGLSGTTFAFWQNVVQSAAAPLQGGAGITPGSTTIESLMLPLYLRLTRGTDQPDLIVFSQDYYTFYEVSQTSIKRYTSDDSAQGGFVSLKYKKADVIFEGDGIVPSAHGYFINTDYLEMVTHTQANWDQADEKPSLNQDAVVIPILFQGNLVCSCRFLQGVMKA